MYKPKIMGILNITPDSFSDGGKFYNHHDAIKHSIDLVSNGADIIDIGAESTNPYSTAISAEMEWNRLKHIIAEISNLDIAISLDSRNYETIRKSISYGIKYVNDVSGAADKNIIALAKDNNINYILMHNLGIPADNNTSMPDDKPVILQLKEWFTQKIDLLLNLGLKQSQIILDPGIGFGKNKIPQQNFEILSNINEIKNLGLPIILGHSRKYFYKMLNIDNKEDRDLETVITSLHYANSLDIIRVHNVEWHSRAFNLLEKLSA